MQIDWRISVFAVELLLAAWLVAWLHNSSRGERPPLKFLFKLLFAGAVTALVAAVIELRYVLPGGPVSLRYLLSYNLAVSFDRGNLLNILLRYC